MIVVNAVGDACPLPVVKTKDAVRALGGSGVVQTLVDNKVAVENLTRFAAAGGYTAEQRERGDGTYEVTITVGEAAKCEACNARSVVVAVGSACMGEGDEALGRTLMKSFLYALAQQDELPSCILFYNGGARIPCEGSDALEDLKAMEARGVEILTCGTCLNYYGLGEKLRVGSVTNMYAIVEKLTKAELIVKP